MTDTRGYAGLDRFRVAAALLVVAIHTSPLLFFGATADFVLTRALARVAVPFFFMATGFFVLGDAVRLRRALRKTGLLYLACIALYLPVNAYAGHLGGLTLAGLLRALFFGGTFYHLWYMPAVLLGLLVAAGLRRLPPALSWACALLLYAVGLLGDSYYGLSAGAPALRAAVDALLAFFGGYTRNGLFFAPLFLCMGAAMRNARPLGRGPAAAGLALALAALVAEALCLRGLGWQAHDSMYLALPAALYFLFSLLLRDRGRGGRALGTVSMLVYVLHPLVILAVRAAARLLGLWGPLVENSLGHYLAVCAGSLFAACFLLRLRRVAPGPDPRARAWVRCDAEALRGNLRALRGLLPEGAALMAVLKAGAYGHGARQAARVLTREGVRDFAVATAAEGAALRRAGARGCILVLGCTGEGDFPLLTRWRLTQTVVDEAYAEALSRAPGRVRAHVKLDTGMHRLGLDWRDMEALARVYALPGLRVTGLYSHLATADCAGPEDEGFLREQAARFFSAAEALRARGVEPGRLHLQSSYGLLQLSEPRCALARVGIALYGLRSAREDAPAVWPALRPVLSLHARVAQVRRIPAGERAGYGLAFTAGRDTTLAVLSIGYADGLPRALSDGVGAALLHGRRVPIVGRICMDQCTVDATEAGDVRRGDVATLIGRDGEAEIPCEALAAQCGTLTNEVLSRLGARLPRVWE